MAAANTTKTESRIDLLERRTAQARAVLVALAAALDGDEPLADQDAVSGAIWAARELLEV